MNDPKTTSMTLGEMRAAWAQGHSASDFERVRREAAEGVEPAMDDDSPDASALMREAIVKRRLERVTDHGSRERVVIPLDHDVLAAFRAEGPGWKARMNAALREWLTQRPSRPLEP